MYLLTNLERYYTTLCAMCCVYQKLPSDDLITKIQSGIYKATPHCQNSSFAILLWCILTWIFLNWDSWTKFINSMIHKDRQTHIPFKICELILINQWMD